MSLRAIAVGDATRDRRVAFDDWHAVFSRTSGLPPDAIRSNVYTLDIQADGSGERSGRVENT